MNAEFEDEISPVIDDLKQGGQEALEQTRAKAGTALEATSDYIRANPWVAVAGAVVLGGVLGALLKPSREEPTKSEVVRGWLDEAYAKLPSQKQVQSVADSTGLPSFLKELQRKLHLS